MFLTGYHGTSNTAADNIMKTGQFAKSMGDRQWLGDGIYFYDNLEDAYNWHNIQTGEAAEAIIHAVIKIKDNEYLYLNSEEGAKLIDGVIDYICASMKVKVEEKYAQQNQCAVANMIWQRRTDLKVMAASFPTLRRKMATMLDLRPLRREFCVRDNSCIRYIDRIQRSDLND